VDWLNILYFYQNRKLKQVIVIRHAKSDQRFWGNDFERPLNDRGKSDAHVMGTKLKERKIPIDRWISSPALRARKTAEIFATELGLDSEALSFISALYHAPPEVFYEILEILPDDINTVAFFSHNPGISYFVNSLVPGTQVDNMPTSAMFAVSAEISRWGNFRRSKKEFLFFDYPKKGG
jgi:phosphohistidine phosphatase